MECDYGVKDEYIAIESRRGWQPLFMEIRDNSAIFSIAESKKAGNHDLNRYRDVNPYDHSRIILSRGNCNYINASLVKMEKVNRDYILTQGPLPSTVSHFWTMVWEQNCRAIVMLNNTVEKNQVKCHTYWPVECGDSSRLVFEAVQLSVELVSESRKKNYILRTFNLSDLNDGVTRTVEQYHYTTWPDFGVPSTPSDFIQFLQDIRKSGGLGPGTEEEPVGPAVIHCSAGIGRSGTFCIVDTALLQLARGERVNVKELVLEMRRYRMGLIQTAEQLRFSYQSIIQGAELMNIDMKMAVPPANGVNSPGSGHYSDDDSSCDDISEDDDDSIEEVEEEDDVETPGPFHSQTIGYPLTANGYEAAISDGTEEQPPPIPPRGESLSSPDVSEVYDRPLPLVPNRPKRPHKEVEDASGSDEDVDDTGSSAGAAVEDASAGSEMEKKRRKQLSGDTIPRTAESDNRSTVRRRRQERKEKTQRIISSIKDKQKEQERSDERLGILRAGSKWFGLGVGIIILVCVGFRYFQG